MLTDSRLALKCKTYTVRSQMMCLKNEKRAYVKRGIWHLGGREKQKGRFLPILGTIAKLFLLSATGSIGSKLSEGVGQKIFGGRNRRKLIKRLKN